MKTILGKGKTLPKDDYLKERCKEIGITVEEARRDHALDSDKYGNLVQYIRHIDGSPCMFMPKFGDKARQYSKYCEKEQLKTDYNLNIDPDSLLEQLHIKRFKPSYLEKRKDLGKYKYQSKDYTGVGVKPIPTKLAIDNYNNKTKIKNVVFVEGYLKALALSLNSIDSIAFSGITNYKLNNDLRDYLLTVEPSQITMMYDGDYLGIKKKDRAWLDSRPKGFFNSAYKFATELHRFFENNNLKTKIFWCATKQAKGVDDLLQVNDKDKVIKALNTFKDSEYFEFMSLPKSSFKPKLKNKILLGNPRQFYHFHKDTIKKEPFRFNGIKYQVNGKTLTVLDDPFHIDLEVKTIKAKKYLDDARTEIETIIEKENYISLEMLTGGGKTAFWLGYKKNGIFYNGYFKRNNKLGVFILPHTLNVRQLEKDLKHEKGFGFMSGGMSRIKKTKALQNDVIICTYDQLKNIPYLEQRILVIDESHNLVNKMGFRAETLRYVFSRFGDAKKVVLMSGTPPKLLCKHFNFHCVKIKTKQFNMVNVFGIESSSTTAATVSFLKGCNTKDNNKRVVFYNSVDGAKLLKESLVKEGVYSGDEIDIITREHLNNNLSSTYNSILNKSIIEGARLVICTCLLSEGVNINNKNIAEVLTIDCNCIDTFRQFVARFRKIKSLNVYSIRKTQYNTPDSFKKLILNSFNYSIKIAEIQTMLAQLAYDEQIRDLKEDDPEFWEHKIPSYDYKPFFSEFSYIEGNTAKVDVLKLMYDEKVRQGKMNNDYFYTKIDSYQNIEFKGLCDDCTDIEVKQGIADIHEQIEAEKSNVLFSLKSDIETSPEIVIKALEYHYKTTKDKNYIKKLEKLTKGIEVGIDDVSKYYYENEHLFNLKYFRAAIRQFAKMWFAKHPDPSSFILMNEKEFSIELRKIKYQAEKVVYENRNKRLKLNAQHRQDIKSKIRIEEKIINANPDGKIYLNDLLSLLSSMTSFKDMSNYDKKSNGVNTHFFKWTRTKAINLIKEFFDIEKMGDLLKITKPEPSNFYKKDLDKLLEIITLC